MKRSNTKPGLGRGNLIIGGREKITKEYNGRNHLLSIHPSIQPSSHPAIQPSSHPSIHPASHPSIHLHKLYTITRYGSSIIAGMMEEGNSLTLLFTETGSRLQYAESFERCGHHDVGDFLNLILTPRPRPECNSGRRHDRSPAIEAMT